MKKTVNVQNLNNAWLCSFEEASVLSIDCFDTLFWRKVIRPTDVFTALECTEIYKLYNLSARKRMIAEERLRGRNLMLSGSPEVTLEEIYREMDGRLEAAAIQELMQAEIGCEIEFGFIFRPVADLIDLARARGMKVIIVSDTYFNSSQLRKLLFSVMPALEEKVEHIFCSAEYRRGKTTGIWPYVLKDLALRPHQVLHLGDNYHADFEGPMAFSIPAQHLVSFQPDVGDILSQRQQISAQVFPRGTNPMVAPQYFHGQMSNIQSFNAEAFGYASLGPTFYAFARYIEGEIKSLELQGRTVKVAFLLRDGYLPGRACEALSGDVIGSYINISRFTALAASLDSEDAIIAALQKVKGVATFSSALRQLLIPKAQAESILKKLQGKNSSWPNLVRAVLDYKVKAVIIERSKLFRQRLLVHVQRLTGVGSGDILMLVDLGYSGTVQMSLHKVFKEILGVELVGRYLVADDLSYDDLDKRGLIDPSWADPQLITSVIRYIAALEMVCTLDQPSTVDYKQDGTPIFEKTGKSLVQREKVSEVQLGCLRFIREFVEQEIPFKPTVDAQQLRYAAGIDLLRLLYFPVAGEISCLEGFKFDSNMGTDWQHPLLDVEAGEKALRSQGLGYIKTSFEHTRANMPMELRHSNLALSALVFSQIRHGFNINLAALSLRSESLDVLVVSGSQFTKESLIATYTYDGFYAARIPLSKNFDVSVLLGARYKWVQIESVQVIDPKIPADAVDLVMNEGVLFDGMHHRGNGLFELEELGLVCFQRYDKNNVGLSYSMVFRPLMLR